MPVKLKTTTLRRLQLESLNDSYVKTVGKYFPDSNFVPGHGSLRPKYLFIGEAPGGMEDEQGEPFVGRSGELLNTWLGWGGIRRYRDCYITNVVKYRPDDNRDPTETEVSASTYFLRREIAILKPVVVVTLGTFATRVFNPEARISTAVGTCRQRTVDKHTCMFVPMFHPSYVLKNRNMEDDCFDHMNKVLHAYNVAMGTVVSSGRKTNINKTITKKVKTDNKRRIRK